MRNVLLLLVLAIILLLVNYGIYQRERIISQGRPVLLELAPIDPRSLMQGGYMALRFKVADEVMPRLRAGGAHDGRLVLSVDERNQGRFRRFDDTTPLAEGEALIRYRVRNGQFKIATNAFFFQERQGELYRNARYGEVRVSPDGAALLVALRGENQEKLGPPGKQ